MSTAAERLSCANKRPSSEALISSQWCHWKTSLAHSSQQSPSDVGVVHLQFRSQGGNWMGCFGRKRNMVRYDQSTREESEWAVFLPQNEEDLTFHSFLLPQRLSPIPTRGLLLCNFLFPYTQNLHPGFLPTFLPGSWHCCCSFLCDESSISGCEIPDPNLWTANRICCEVTRTNYIIFLDISFPGECYTWPATYTINRDGILNLWHTQAIYVGFPMLLLFPILGIYTPTVPSLFVRAKAPQ